MFVTKEERERFRQVVCRTSEKVLHEVVYLSVFQYKTCVVGVIAERSTRSSFSQVILTFCKVDAE